ncbi:MAG TPA: L,D-transpeptidase family protein [Solirubrobacteraceae bacterium]|jgi:peptidoglycan hydrolase-like protein with peptidoglycan-binding domain|nr:L,D-transpeptidase family protein [Solirubrobacteraceae bacterium]
MVVRSFEPHDPLPPPRKRRLIWLAAVVVLIVAGFAVLVALWSGATLRPDSSALADLKLQPFAGTLVRAAAIGPDGRTIPLRISHGRLRPLEQLTPGEVITVDAVIRRPGWLGWALGSIRDERLTIRAPTARVSQPWLTASSSGVRVSFDQPVSALSYALPGQPATTLQVSSPARSLTLPGLGGSGTVEVRAAARSWEQLSAPQLVSWFPASKHPVLVADPAPGSDVSPFTPIRLTFSRSLATLFGSAVPALSSATRGTWTRVDSHTLLFTPSGAGAPLGSVLSMKLPQAVSVSAASGALAPLGTELDWNVPPGSTLRLQQLLAQEGYLPLDWQPAGAPVAQTLIAQAEAAVSAPKGSFSWRYPNTPSQLVALWREGRPNQIIRGAVMRFEQDNGLGIDGIAGPLVWRALLRDAIHGRRIHTPYSYVFVRVKVPQLLSLWSGGHIVLTSAGNTGIPSRPTAPGTFPVFEHIPVGTMTGTNPDGSHYNDPGIRWISYFNGGDALHAFPRASYGTPQSLGCVELPLPAAAKVWPYTPIGTLVTIE